MPKCTKLVNYRVLRLLDTVTRRELCSQSVAQLWRVFVCADLLQSLFQRTHCKHRGHKLWWKNITGTSMTCKPWFNHSYHQEISPKNSSTLANWLCNGILHIVHIRTGQTFPPIGCMVHPCGFCKAHSIKKNYCAIKAIFTQKWNNDITSKYYLAEIMDAERMVTNVKAAAAVTTDH